MVLEKGGHATRQESIKIYEFKALDLVGNASTHSNAQTPHAPAHILHEEKVVEEGDDEEEEENEEGGGGAAWVAESR